MSECPSVINPFVRGPAAYRIQRYRERAARLRAMVEDLAAEEWRDILVRLAESYEDLACATEEEGIA